MTVTAALPIPLTVDKSLFIDLWITIEDGLLSTRIFRKETATNALLRANGHHPDLRKNRIPVGQFLRNKQNCTRPSDYRREGKGYYGSTESKT